eukprot:scaffold9745_cov102-Skeletonema_dohrnii-CCMP3373.AAC.2
MLQLLRPVELVMPSARLTVVSGAVSSAHSSATNSSTPANSNNREGRGNSVFKEVEKSIHYIPRNVCGKIGRSTLSP